MAGVSTLDIPLTGAVEDAAPQPDDARYTSVTSVLNALSKEALVYWAAMETSVAAVDGIDIVQARLQNEGRESAIDYLKGARFRRPRGQRTAKDLGTVVHAACEQWALTGVRPQVDAEVEPFLRQFGKFLDEWQPTYIATEVTVYSPRYGYAGTADAFMDL